MPFVEPAAHGCYLTADVILGCGGLEANAEMRVSSGRPGPCRGAPLALLTPGKGEDGARPPCGRRRELVGALAVNSWAKTDIVELRGT